MTQAMECGNRRAEIEERREGAEGLPLFPPRTEIVVTFHRMSGKVRRTKHQVWKVVTNDVRHARRLATRWTRNGLLGAPVLG